jgi:hypothetical protein
MASNSNSQRPRIALIVQDDEPINSQLLPRWIATFAEPAAILRIHEGLRPKLRRLRYEVRRVGLWRMLDVFAFRAYYRCILSSVDQRWELSTIETQLARLPPLPASIPELTVEDPNSEEAADFLRQAGPTLVVARCKWLLRRSIYEIPRLGTYVLHPGICPEYRNAHGGFWALAKGEPRKVGLTLLRVDDGIDTGPIFGFFYCKFDPAAESHVRIQHRLLIDNLSEIQAALLKIIDGVATRIDVSGTKSGNWGQPWLSAYMRYRRAWRHR